MRATNRGPEGGRIHSSYRKAIVGLTCLLLAFTTLPGFAAQAAVPAEAPSNTLADGSVEGPAGDDYILYYDGAETVGAPVLDGAASLNLAKYGQDPTGWSAYGAVKLNTTAPVNLHALDRFTWMYNVPDAIENDRQVYFQVFFYIDEDGDGVRDRVLSQEHSDFGARLAQTTGWVEHSIDKDRHFRLCEADWTTCEYDRSINDFIADGLTGTFSSIIVQTTISGHNHRDTYFQSSVFVDSFQALAYVGPVRIADAADNDCAPATFQTVQAAVTCAAPGATVLLPADHTFPEHVTIDKPLTVCQGNADMTACGADNDPAHIDGSSLSGGATIRVTSDDVTLSGFRVTGTATGDDDYAIRFQNGGDNAVVNGMTINAVYSGIVYIGPGSGPFTGGTFTDNTITVAPDDMGGYAAVNVDHTADTTISGNDITGGRYGIYLEDHASNAIISDNTVTGAKRGAALCSNYLTTVTGNDFSGALDAGLYIRGCRTSYEAGLHDDRKIITGNDLSGATDAIVVIGWHETYPQWFDDNWETPDDMLIDATGNWWGSTSCAQIPLRINDPFDNDITWEPFADNGFNTMFCDPDLDNDGIPNDQDPDDDNDGHNDDVDAFPADPNEWADNDGDRIGDNADPDDDNDGVDDTSDAFPLDASEWADYDSDGIGDNADPDDDNDGQSDADETTCGSDPTNAGSTSPDNDGDNSPDCVDEDDDNDGHADGDDAFPFDATEHADYDSDGIGDNADPDDDNDGQSDGNDACDPGDIGPFADHDADGCSDAEDGDDDNDGHADNQDACPRGDIGAFADLDNDGCSDGEDNDADNDGHANDVDNCPLGATGAHANDLDNDGCNDAEDTDDDGDGLSDDDETNTFGTDPRDADSDDDGLNDGDEIAYGSNPHDTDSDDDGLGDGEEVHQHGTSPVNDDTDSDGLRDDEELNWGADPNNPDTDGDGINDGDEVDQGSNPTDPDSPGNSPPVDPDDLPRPVPLPL